ncbi:protein OXIDATIVE STRESS 3-like [Miscanthus floridulus]|uniref:protein OXIDATIVE STRESS 3-like n=1 Tax=Miscanthus floridulus TaxID=154761 RepID=UPI003459CE0B
MEAYFLFHGSGRAHAAAPEPACAEQEEDIGSPSDSESPSTSRESAGSSSSELDDDASSSSGSDPDRFEMSALMTELPFKRGLSRFFDGKSQSFASLAAVGSLEDLPKPAARKRLKPSRSCGGALDAHNRGRLLSPRRHCTKPKPAARKQAAARSGALSVLAAVAPRMPPPPPVLARPEGVAAKVLIVN